MADDPQETGLPRALLLADIACPPLREFSSARTFRKNLGWIDPPRDQLILPLAGVRDLFIGRIIRVFELQQSVHDSEMVQDSVRIGFVHIRYLLDLCDSGNERVSALELDDGYDNVFYVADADRCLWRMLARRDRKRNAWVFEAHYGHRLRIPGSRVFL